MSKLQSNQTIIQRIEAHIDKYTHNENNGKLCMRECLDICIQCELRECLEGLLTERRDN